MSNEAGQGRFEWIASISEIRENMREFHRDLEFHWKRARLIAGKQKFWVFDPSAKTFGPGKFIGYRGMTYAKYDNAHAIGITGAPFQGTDARQRIERVSGEAFVVDKKMEDRLEAWMENAFCKEAMRRWAEMEVFNAVQGRA